MKDVLLLHDNARPHTSLRTSEAVARMGWTVLSHPAHSLQLAPSDCQLFGPVKDALRGRHFADDSELQKLFLMCSEVEARNLTTLIYSVSLNVGRSVLEMTDNLWENSLIMAKMYDTTTYILLLLQLHFPRKIEVLLS
jgi:hypothetical protein